MKRLEPTIKSFCTLNAGKNDIDFSLIKGPETLYRHIGINCTLNRFKGDLMGMLLVELFVGNGYRVERPAEACNDGGCDLLIISRQDNSIRYVLHAKNWNNKIDLDDVRKEHLRFCDNYLEKYDLNNTHFCFVSWSFVEGIKDKLSNELNIKVWDEQDITQKLFLSYE